MKTGEQAVVDTQALRKAAAEYLALDVLPRYEFIKHHSMRFSGDLWTLIEEIERIESQRPHDILVGVAMAGVGEARRRLTLVERAGLMGEHERVKKLARSVIALCDHDETLTGITMCLACDRPIPPEEADLPYGGVSPSGGAAASGRIHAACVNRLRWTR
ncbi:DUF6415 family natural product biosynthesis protein [Streptomyces sp. NBC_00847]|uniref:DUF6415 family natural product biosynthesis protein n=1 Tax=unclassified Streptomyces TaxID=2593676 RepID=UPI002253B182|nr:DUF6415 family natural product biosynthesis protein [Streptomyces sp. NBC_00847]MCX4880811.1 DUF6415 family natural product biosynthesis protein [Streptomyces sp. NBC_00847]